MRFKRWKPSLQWSWAYILFTKHHTEINSYYWAHQAAMKGAFSLTAPKTRADSCLEVFPDISGERRRNITLGEWADDYNGFDNWSRLSAVVAISGYLEMYIKMAVDAACQSCPAVLLGGDKEIEGVKLLKTRPGYSFGEQAESCSKGTWGQRIAAFKKCFGSCPQILVDNEGVLDEFRILRNSVGHAFGRDPDLPTIGKHMTLSKAESVSQKRLKSWMKLAYDAASSIEAHLGATYIGSYETIAMYHFWPDRLTGTWPVERDKFRDCFYASTKRSLHRDYVKEMFDFYHGL